MKKMMALLVVLVVTHAATAATPTQPIAPRWYPGVVSAAYQYLCEDTFGGEYVNNNPSFAVAWSCTDFEWCEVRPQTLGCRSVELSSE